MHIKIEGHVGEGIQRSINDTPRRVGLEVLLWIRYEYEARKVQKFIHRMAERGSAAALGTLLRLFVLWMKSND